MNNMFDKLEIEWGEEKVWARPVEWDGEPIVMEDGENVSTAKPTVYEVSCIKCGNMIHFYHFIECDACDESIISPLVNLEDLENNEDEDEDCDFNDTEVEKIISVDYVDREKT